MKLENWVPNVVLVFARLHMFDRFVIAKNANLCY